MSSSLEFNRGFLDDLEQIMVGVAKSIHRFLWPRSDCQSLGRFIHHSLSKARNKKRKPRPGTEQILPTMIKDKHTTTMVSGKWRE